jgi:hypothetical protein
MLALVGSIHAFYKGVDARDKHGHDDVLEFEGGLP